MLINRKTPVLFVMLAACLMLGLMGAMTPVEAAFPQESIPPLREAQAAVKDGEWGKALDRYTEHLRKLEPRHYRDKKTYEKFIEDYEEANPEAGLEGFERIAQARLKDAKEKGDPIAEWRLHHLLSVIGRRQGDVEQEKAHLDRAIDAYPSLTYRAPAKLSKLHHMYNAAAILRMKQSMEEGEDYLVEAFENDKRFVHVYLPTLRDFYASADAPERLPGLVQRLIAACDAKAERFPKLADRMRQLKAELQR